MSNRTTATRNTCFAIISAIETDLRTFIVEECEAAGFVDILPTDVREAATRRWHADHSSSAQVQPESDFELIDYTDFADLTKLLHRTLEKAPPDVLSCIKKIILALERTAPVRNRVCHSRPLEPEDLPSCLDLSDELGSLSELEFTELRRTRTLLNTNPGSVLGLQIPSFWSTDKTAIHHNLPLPEFDETGFLGRRKDRQALHKLLRSHYPVVTVVGEGGVGKTALALRCLYDLLDEQDPPYEVIVWSSLKMTALTESGVVQLNNDVATTLGLLGSVAANLGTPSVSQRSAESLIGEITQYLSEYRILVAIDNLETIASTPLRELLLRMPRDSKLLITSRVGIGEFETRYSLESLDMATSVDLLRRFASVLGVADIARTPEPALRRYAKKLFNNPLLLKWFTSAAARGADPKSLLNRRGNNFQEALSFCFANVFDKLDASERRLLDTLVSARRPLTAAEIYYLNPNVDQSEIEWALGSLHNSSIVKRLAPADGTLRYHLSEPAASYVSLNEAPSRKQFNAVQTRMRELRRMSERQGVAQAQYAYEIFSVRADTSDERIAAVLLSQALDQHRNDVSAARKKVEEARRLLPTFGEIYRVSSLIEASDGELYRASEELDRAVDCDPESTIIRYTYAQFLIKQLEDFDGALAHLEVAEKRDRGSAPLRSAKALVLSRLGRCAEAARLYEALLENIEERPRRWRVATRDQAAETYRRWAELDLKNRDIASFNKHITRALDHIEAAIEQRDCDDKTAQRLGRVMEQAVIGTGGVDDSERSEEYITRVEGFVGQLPRGVVHIRDLSYITRAVGARQDLLDRIIAVASQGDGSGRRRRGEPENRMSRQREEELGAFRAGRIKKLPQLVRYGFIEDHESGSWFFHYNSLVDRADERRLQEGVAVVFAVGRNERGPCAVRVSLRELV